MPAHTKLAIPQKEGMPAPTTNKKCPSNATHKQASLVNQRSAAYSRAVGRSFLNLFFPEAQATTDPGSYRYYIYTINDTIQHAHRLLDTYFEV
jgi:hypothetical protein